VQIPRIGPSLGGVESLIEQPLVMSYYEARPEDRRTWGIADNMIRLACAQISFTKLRLITKQPLYNYLIVLQFSHVTLIATISPGSVNVVTETGNCIIVYNP
jgi:hypothetical protein